MNMKSKHYFLSGLVALNIVATTATAVSAKVGSFQTIEQPLPLKLGITTIGFGLIGLELWWFLAKGTARK